MGDVDIDGGLDTLGESDGSISGDMVGGSSADGSEIVLKSTVGANEIGAFVGDKVVGFGVGRFVVGDTVGISTQGSSITGPYRLNGLHGSRSYITAPRNRLGDRYKYC